MIIWGSKAKLKQVATGQFYCPQCRKESDYAQMRLSRYFTLYFIPLFPTATLGEGVRCESCTGEFNMSVLALTAAQIEAALQPWTCAKCGNRNSSSERKCVACGDTPAVEPPPLPPTPPTPPRIAQRQEDDEEF